MADNAVTTIGADARISGEMTFESTARILGTFEGKIISKGELQVTENATCKATVEVGRLHLEGSVEGDVTARERLELTSKATLKGNIVAPRLAVAEGATLIGHLTIGDGSVKNESAPAVGSVETKPAQAKPLNLNGNGPVNGRAASGQDFRADHRAEAFAGR